MAISSTMVWEVRSTATAANANGGGFKPGASGTDWSQQDAAQYNLTNVTTAAANAILLTASASADMVGNVAHLISGTNSTPGWYEIISVSVGVSITLDQTCCTAALAAGVVNIGGGISLGSSTTNQNDANFALATIAGNTVWLKGSLTLATNPTFTAGVAGTPIKLIGYQTVRGDTPTGSNRPTINCQAFLLAVGARNQISNVVMTGTNTTQLSSSVDTIVNNVKITNTSTTAGRNCVINAAGAGGYFQNCEFISYRGAAMSLASGAIIDGCYIHDSDIGITTAASTSLVILNSIIANNVTSAITTTGPGTAPFSVKGCSLYGAENKTGTGIVIFNGLNHVVITDNVIYGFATGINDGNGAGFNYENYNIFFNNTTDRTSIATGPNSIAANPGLSGVAQIKGTVATTSGSVLTDGGASFTTVTDNQDFCYLVSGTGITVGQYLITSHTATTLTLDIAPGTSAVGDKVYQITTGRNYKVGTGARQNGFPAAFPGGTTTSYSDIGAVQRDYNIEVPSVADVRLGTSFASGSLTGTLAASGSKHLGAGKMG